MGQDKVATCCNGAPRVDSSEGQGQASGVRLGLRPYLLEGVVNSPMEGEHCAEGGGKIVRFGHMLRITDHAWFGH